MRNKYGELILDITDRLFSDGDSLATLLNDSEKDTLRKFLQMNTIIGNTNVFLRKNLSFIVREESTDYIFKLYFSGTNDEFDLLFDSILRYDGSAFDYVTLLVNYDPDGGLDLENSNIRYHYIPLGGE